MYNYMGKTEEKENTAVNGTFRCRAGRCSPRTASVITPVTGNQLRLPSKAQRRVLPCQHAFPELIHAALNCTAALRHCGTAALRHCLRIDSGLLRFLYINPGRLPCL